MNKKELFEEIKNSYSEYFNSLFRKATLDAQGDFEKFCELIGEDIPLQTSKTKIGGDYFIKNIQPKPELISGGAFLYNIELGSFAFLYTVKVGANSYFDSFVTNIQIFEESLNRVQDSFFKFQESEFTRTDEHPANSLTDIFVFSFFPSDVRNPSGSSRCSKFLEIILLSSNIGYSFEEGGPLDLFIEEAYISVSAPILKRYNSKTKFRKATKSEIIAFGNSHLISYIQDASEREDLTNLFVEYNMTEVYQKIQQKVEKLLNSLNQDFFKES